MFMLDVGQGEKKPVDKDIYDHFQKQLQQIISRKDKAYEVRLKDVVELAKV